jgi:hypothetical protein
VSALLLPHRQKSARVALLGLWLDVYGDRAVWSRSVRWHYAAAVVRICARWSR